MTVASSPKTIVVSFNKSQGASKSFKQVEMEESVNLYIKVLELWTIGPRKKNYPTDLPSQNKSGGQTSTK